MNKIVFLDIDGPVIPINVGMMNSILRATHDKDSIEYLSILCEETGAKVVTNSMHNYTTMYDGYELQDDLIDWGLDKKYFHKNWRTIFPHVNYEKINSSVRGIGRLYAIEEWIKLHGETQWVCFDDRKFTDMENLIHIDDGMGIRYHHIEKAFDILSK